MVDKKKNKGTLKKVFSYIGKYKYFLILSMFFAAVTVGLTLYAPILVGKAIDCIIGKGNVDFVNMKSILIKVAVIVVSTALIQWLMNVCNNKITYNVSRDLRKKAPLAAVLWLSLCYILKILLAFPCFLILLNALLRCFHKMLPSVLVHLSVLFLPVWH